MPGTISRHHKVNKIRPGFCFYGVRHSEENAGNRKKTSKPTVSKLPIDVNKNFEENRE